MNPPERQRALSHRELDVLRLAAEGFDGRQIGNRLNISPATANTYLKYAKAKLGVRTREEAISEARKLGIL